MLSGSAAEGAPRSGTERGRGVAKFGVDALQGRQERQHHERHLHLGQHHDDARLAEEEPQRLVDEAERQQRLVHDALAAEDHDPGEGAHDDARQDRQHDDEEERRLPARSGAARNPRERHAEDEADEGGLEAEEQRVGEDRQAEAVGKEAPVLRPGDGVHLGLAIEAHDE
jgi:hypothetical protein